MHYRSKFQQQINEFREQSQLFLLLLKLLKLWKLWLLLLGSQRRDFSFEPPQQKQQEKEETSQTPDAKPFADVFTIYCSDDKEEEEEHQVAEAEAQAQGTVAGVVFFLGVVILGEWCSALSVGEVAKHQGRLW